MCFDLNFDEFPRPVVVFDTETTGTSNQDRIVEFAAIRFERGCAPVKYSTLINPNMPISYGAQRVHNISDRMVASAPIYRQIHSRIAALFSDADVFAHNLPFDRRFLQQECDRIGHSFSFSGHCTLKIARKIYPGRSGRGAHTLDTVASLCGVQNPNAHRALADVQTLARVLVHFTSNRPEHVLPLVR
jgi:DNA polymerase III epsilon subunit-like protein